MSEKGEEQKYPLCPICGEKLHNGTGVCWENKREFGGEVAKTCHRDCFYKNPNFFKGG